MSRSSKRKRADSPEVSRTSDGCYRHEWKDATGSLHRDDGFPALLIVEAQHMNLQVEERQWVALHKGHYVHGVLHRENDLPAQIWNGEGSSGVAGCLEMYWKHGKLHRGYWPVGQSLIESLTQPLAVVYSDGTGDMFNQGVYQGTRTDHGHDLGCNIKWYSGRQVKHGPARVSFNRLLHRDNDLPAHIALQNDPENRVVLESWYQNGQRHRSGDQPADINHITGEQIWWVEGSLHRDHDRPAVVSPEMRQWYTRGVKTRIGAPAVETATGGWEWWLNGERHRLNGPWSSTSNEYRVNGKLHREDGLPAVDTPALTEYALNGLHYRADGPAYILRRSGVACEMWYTGTPGVLFRQGGPAMIADHGDGCTTWSWREKPGEYFREDGGPTVELYKDGVLVEQRWWTDAGMRSRVSGPAVIRNDGSREWWLNGQMVSERMHRRIVLWVKRAAGKIQRPYLGVGDKLVQVRSLYRLLV